MRAAAVKFCLLAYWNGKDPETIAERLTGCTTVVAGPSGVGKSSLTNYLQPDAGMQVGEISRKIDRGKHTTRHTELIWIGKDTYFLDTPGFSSLYLQNLAGGSEGIFPGILAL